MLELLLCSSVTILPDFLFRRFVQGKRVGREITLFTVWYELRWGIVLCLLLTISLITAIFYFHPSTSSATSVFRTVTILPETNGRVAETFVDINQHVKKGDPLFRLDDTEQKAAVETTRRKLAEIEAELTVARIQVREAEGRIAQAQGMLAQAQDEYDTRNALLAQNSTAIARRDVERAEVQVATQQGMVDAAVAARDALNAQVEFQLPARKASAEAALHEAQVELDKTLVVAGTDGIVQQFALRAGDVVNPMLRPAGILVPERRITGLAAGFGQIESQVMKPGMIGEVTCAAKPWRIIPMVVTEVQDVIAGGQIRPTDQLLDVGSFARGGTITVIMEPLYEGALDGLPQGASCIANAYSSNHDRLADESLGGFQRFALHAIDAVGLVHALILRIQALMLPVQTLVLKGH
ncbi:MAG TPA: HlyD family secretion protein [Paracoccus sp. (in: a-proteobacteria)]|uniref:HlyD family secretion protein n=1 Tax=Paracoccus sp. TaxID=267 RepID=UPI002C7A3BAB|nr:HlyD family secretion protein [Paracoccus sp. (in: a-proteobacteria)]HWL56303.1 HlyD family secretion protein [Paracoccus sp. (in: a-proteobacteria)]